MGISPTTDLNLHLILAYQGLGIWGSAEAVPLIYPVIFATLSYIYVSFFIREMIAWSYLRGVF